MHAAENLYLNKPVISKVGESDYWEFETEAFT
jgi:hypothetical protein